MNILLIRDEANGDVFLTTRAVCALRRKYKDANIYYLVKRGCKAVVESNPNIDYIVEYESFSKIRNTVFDLVIDWQDHNRLPYGLQYKDIRRAWNNPDMRNDTDSRRRRSKKGVPFAYQYAEIAGVELKDEDKFFIHFEQTDLVPESKKRTVVVSFDSCWKTKAFDGTQVIKRLAALPDTRVVIVGKYSGWGITGPNIINLVRKTSIPALAYIIKQADVFIGIDSFPAHLADAFGIPSITLWTATSPESILTYKTNNIAIRAKTDCHPCYLQKCPNMKCKKTIGVEEIMDAFNKIGTQENGTVWILIPCFNMGSMTFRNIKRLEERTKYNKYKVILIDDGSNEDNAALFDAIGMIYDNVTVIHQENKGFVGAITAGIKHAMKKAMDGDYVLWFNNDVVIENGDWLHKLVDASGDEAIVGPQGSRLKNNFSHAGYVNENPHYIDGWCKLVPARYFIDDEIGLPDQNIKMFSEDADYDIRAQRLGIPIKVVKNVGVKHLHHQTCRKIGANTYVQNSIKYMQNKWGNLADALNFDASVKVEKCPVCGEKNDGILDDVIVCKRCFTTYKSTVKNKHLLFKKFNKLGDVYSYKNEAMAYWRMFDKYDISTMQKRGNFVEFGAHNVPGIAILAKDNGWNVYAVTKIRAFNNLYSTQGISCIAELNGYLGENSANLIVFPKWTIEQEKDIATLLDKAARILSPNGFMAIDIAKENHVEWISVPKLAPIISILEKNNVVLDSVEIIDGRKLFLYRKEGINAQEYRKGNAG